MSTPRPEMESALEAILFVSSEPVPRGRLLEVFDEGDREAAAEALETVLERYQPAEGRGLMVDEVAGGIRLVTRPELGGWLRRFFEVRGSSKLSMAALETLAIIAYRQPITGPEIQELRGVSVSGVVRTLLEKRLIRIAGRKAVVGNPFLYRTSREFLVHFGLQSLKELPPLEEFEEAFAAAASIEISDEDEDGEAGGEGPEPVPEPDREEAILQEAARLDEAEDDDAEEAQALAEAAEAELAEVEEA